MFEMIFILLLAFFLFVLPFKILEFVVTGAINVYQQWSHASAVRHETERSEYRSAMADARSRIEERKRQRDDARRQRLAQIEQLRRRAVETKQTKLARQKTASEQRRRNDARAVCERQWAIRAPHISTKFTRTDFDRFVRAFMTDGHSAEEVESRARQLLEIIDAHFQACEATKPPRRFEGIEDVTTWFIEQQARIQSLPLDEQMLDEHLARLNVTYAELCERMLEAPQ